MANGTDSDIRKARQTLQDAHRLEKRLKYFPLSIPLKGEPVRCTVRGELTAELKVLIDQLRAAIDRHDG